MIREKRTVFLVFGVVWLVMTGAVISLDEATAGYIRTLYHQKRSTEVTTEARSFLSRFPLSPFFGEVAVMGGESAYREKNYYLGRYFFEQAFKKTKEQHLLRQSLLGMAKCTYKMGAYEEAARFFETYAREFDDPLVNPVALYYAAVCALASGRTEDATRYREWLTLRYPDSPYIGLITAPPARTAPSPQPVTSSPQDRGKGGVAVSPPGREGGSSTLNEVGFVMPRLATNTTNILIITNIVTITTTNEVRGENTNVALAMNENDRYLSLLEVKARLLQLKAQTLDEELAGLGIGGLP